MAEEVFLTSEVKSDLFLQGVWQTGEKKKPVTQAQE